jgi:hypothetical protein
VREEEARARKKAELDKQKKEEDQTRRMQLMKQGMKKRPEGRPARRN